MAMVTMEKRKENENSHPQVQTMREVLGFSLLGVAHRLGGTDS